MYIYMISYDQHSPTNNREKVEGSIKSLGTWCKYLTTTYLLKTPKNIFDVESEITKHLDSNDRLIVTKVEKPIRGWLSQGQWNWIGQNL